MRAPVVVMALLLVSPRAEACPRCNLGYLAESVKSARNIYLGRVVRPLKPWRVGIRVERVLRGPLKKGQLVEVSARDPVWGVRLIDGKRDVGKLLLLSDPSARSGVTVFPVLDPIFEEEVRLLMQSKPRVTSVAQAIRMVQGVSEVSYTAGLKYIRRHRKAATAPLIKELERIRTAVFSGREADSHSHQATDRDTHRLAALVSALLSGVRAKSPGYAQSRTYVLRQVQRFLGHKWRALADITAAETAVANRQTTFLGWLLSHTPKNSGLRREMRRRLVRGFPTLKGEGIASAVYTLVVNGTSPPAALRSLKQAGKNEAMATGLYLAAISGQLSETRAAAALKRAGTLANSAALKKKITEQRSYMR